MLFSHSRIEKESTALRTNIATVVTFTTNWIEQLVHRARLSGKGTITNVAGTAGELSIQMDEFHATASPNFFTVV